MHLYKMLWSIWQLQKQFFRFLQTNSIRFPTRPRWILKSKSKEIGGWRPSTHTFLCNVIIILALVKYGKTMPCSTLDDFRLLCLILLKDAILEVTSWILSCYWLAIDWTIEVQNGSSKWEGSNETITSKILSRQEIGVENPENPQALAQPLSEPLLSFISLLNDAAKAKWIKHDKTDRNRLWKLTSSRTLDGYISQVFKPPHWVGSLNLVNRCLHGHEWSRHVTSHFPWSNHLRLMPTPLSQQHRPPVPKQKKMAQVIDGYCAIED